MKLALPALAVAAVATTAFGETLQGDKNYDRVFVQCARQNWSLIKEQGDPILALSFTHLPARTQEQLKKIMDANNKLVSNPSDQAILAAGSVIPKNFIDTYACGVVRKCITKQIPTATPTWSIPDCAYL